MTETTSSQSAWANPAPAGITAYSLACFCYWAMLTGRVPESGLPVLGVWLLGGFLIQLIVALVELCSGALLGGNIFLVFSGFFMFAAGAVKLLPGLGIHATAEVDGYAWLVLFLTVVLWTPAYLKTSPKVMCWLVLLLDVGTFFLALTCLGWLGKGFGGFVSGWSFAASGLLGIYLAAAIVLDFSFDKKVLPLGKPMLRA